MNGTGLRRPSPIRGGHEWDFVGTFEGADDHLGTFDQICQSLRDVRQNPEWQYRDGRTGVARTPKLRW